MDKKNNKKKKSIVGTIEATTILILVALLIVATGYMYLSFKNGYTFTDLIDNIVGNLIGVLSAFLLFDILYNKLTQDAYTKETSQQIARTLLGKPEIMDAFSEEDKKSFMKSTLDSMLRDDDAVDMLTANMAKYFDKVKGSRIRKQFDYTITLESKLSDEYIEEKFPHPEEYYLIDEEFKFNVKYLAEVDDSYDDYVYIGFAYDKKSLDAGLLENGKDADFSRCIFNEDLVVLPEAIRYINDIPSDKLVDKINKLFVPVLRIDNSDNDAEEELVSVDRKNNGLVFKFKVNYEHGKDTKEHNVSLYFKMPRLWNSIFEVAIIDPTKEPHIKLKYPANQMDVTMYSYLNKENNSNMGALIKRAGLYDIAIKNEWIYPKSGVLFSIKHSE